MNVEITAEPIPPTITRKQDFHDFCFMVLAVGILFMLISVAVFPLPVYVAGSIMFVVGAILDIKEEYGNYREDRLKWDGDCQICNEEKLYSSKRDGYVCPWCDL